MYTNLRLETKRVAAHLREARCKSETSCARKLPRCEVRMNETVAIAAQLMRAGNLSALVVKDVVRTEGKYSGWYVYGTQRRPRCRRAWRGRPQSEGFALIQCSNWSPAVRPIRSNMFVI